MGRSDNRELSAPWHPLSLGNGEVARDTGTIYCRIFPDSGQSYHDAQISDYAGLRSPYFPWRPPLRLRVRAWASHPVEALRGTAGFGFWNQPFIPGEIKLRLPQAVWFFFGSPPNNMALAKGQRGNGWKAATFDAARPLFLALLPLTPLGFLLMRVPLLYRLLWPIGQRAIGVSEQQLAVDIAVPHVYELHWLPHGVLFWVDEKLVHSAPTAPQGPLGFIAWIDNQYAVVTPQGNLGFGFVPIEQPQWIALESISIDRLR